MNVAYTENNAADVAKRLKVDYSTVTGWCRRNIIDYVDVSGGVANKPRYQIPEYEVQYLEKLIKDHGVRKAILYYDRIGNDHKPHDIEPVEKPYEIFKKDAKVAQIAEKTTAKVAEDNKTDEKVTKDKFNAEKITNTILYIQDIKERLEDLEAEKNQLLNELEQLRKEVMDVL